MQLQNIFKSKILAIWNQNLILKILILFSHKEEVETTFKKKKQVNFYRKNVNKL